MGFLRSRVFSLKGLAPKEGCPVGSKAVSRCAKLERYPLKAYLWCAVGQQVAHAICMTRLREDLEVSNMRASEEEEVSHSGS